MCFRALIKMADRTNKWHSHDSIIPSYTSVAFYLNFSSGVTLVLRYCLLKSLLECKSLLREENRVVKLKRQIEIMV